MAMLKVQRAEGGRQVRGEGRRGAVEGRGCPWELGLQFRLLVRRGQHEAVPTKATVGIDPNPE